MNPKEKTKEVIKRLQAIWPAPKTALEHANPFQLLIATILSAQTTDKTVNNITPALFKAFPTPHTMAAAPVEDIAALIKSVNYHNNKAKNIKATAQKIVQTYDGRVPDTMEALLSLPGVARKTANVVLGDAFGKVEGIVVDTHVMRLSQRLGLTRHKDPKKIELDLMKIVPKEDWRDFSHLLIYYGREYCPARPHICENCPLGDLCPDL